jgi:hypothetical protein
MTLPSLTTVLPPPPSRGAPPRFVGFAQETFDRRAGFRRAADAFQPDRPRPAEERAPMGARRRFTDHDPPPARSGHGRRATDHGTFAGLHLKLNTAPEFVRHSTPFVAQAIGQERGTINVTPRGANSGTAAYDAGVARVDSFFSVIEPISVYA